MTADTPVLIKRRLQAEVIGPIYAEMVAALGEEKASEILDAAIRKASIAEGAAFARRYPGGKPTMADFVKLFELWTAGGALEIDVLVQLRSDAFEDVTRFAFECGRSPLPRLDEIQQAVLGPHEFVEVRVLPFEGVDLRERKQDVRSV